MRNIIRWYIFRLNIGLFIAFYKQAYMCLILQLLRVSQFLQYHHRFFSLATIRILRYSLHSHIIMHMGIPYIHVYVRGHTSVCKTTNMYIVQGLGKSALVRSQCESHIMMPVHNFAYSAFLAANKNKKQLQKQCQSLTIHSISDSPWGPPWQFVLISCLFYILDNHWLIMKL